MRYAHVAQAGSSGNVNRPRALPEDTSAGVYTTSTLPRVLKIYAFRIN